MKLLKLSCNNPKSKTVNFEPGLNIIAGLQLTKEEKKSINGIGKSLSLKILHHILGATFSNSSEDKKLKKYLSNYGTFTLELMQSSVSYEIVKNFSEPSFYINSKKFLQKNYPSTLKTIFLNSTYSISFKQFFNCFSRRYGNAYYQDALTQQGRPKEDYYQRYTNINLLGLETSYVEKRFSISTDLNILDNAKKSLEGFKQEIDSSNLKDILDELTNLYDAKENLVIAENYYSLVERADSLSSELEEIRNEIFTKENLIKRKNNDILTTTNKDIDVEEVEDLYEEAQFFFDEKIKKRLSGAQDFHIKLVVNRKNRLKSDIHTLKEELNTLSNLITPKSKERDSILKDLKGKGALDEIETINSRISSLEEERNSLQRYEHMFVDFTKKKTALDLKNSVLNLESLDYLVEKKTHIENIEDQFRTLVKSFYDNHGGSLKVTSSNKAKYLFNIEIGIPREGSQAVNEVKIFCYDVLLYLLNKEQINFLSHDSCIFSGMDVRQKSIIFKNVLNLIDDFDLQYFVNIGENTLNDILDYNHNVENPILTDIEKSRIKDGVILELYDKSPSSWLMGETFG